LPTQSKYTIRMLFDRTPVATKTVLCLTLCSFLSACAALPSKPEPTFHTEPPCPVVDNQKPLPEVPAEMIYYQQPPYPRLAEQAGLEGTVEIKALVGNDGSVLDAVIFKSSGTPALDEAARVAAPRCRFKPAVRNGQPVCMWVVYKVLFSLE
jgi:protein TonB